MGSRKLIVPGENGFALGAEAILMARPEAFTLTGADEKRLKGTVTARRFVGGSALFTVTLAGGETLEVSAEPKAIRIGANKLWVLMRYLVWFIAQNFLRTSARRPKLSSSPPSRI